MVDTILAVGYHGVKEFPAMSMTHTDPVCGMQVDEKHAGASSTYRGQTFYFCMKACKEKFDANPEKYYNPGGLAR